MEVFLCTYFTLVLVNIVTCFEIETSCPELCQCNYYITNCRGSELRQLPQGISRDVVNLDLSLNSFVSFPSELKDYPNLKHLNLSQNRISTLSHSAFIGLEGLERLDLSHNSFRDWKDIHPEAFSHLSNLVYLDLSHNDIRNIPLFSRHFALASLEVLKLNNCSMRFVPVQVFDYVLKLKELHLARNPIRSINNTFKSQSLKYIDFSGCFLEYLTPKVIKGIESIETFILTNNSFLRILNCDSDSLSYLDVSNSNLESVPTGDMKSLTVLNLQGNFLKMLENNCFWNFPNLIQLNLSRNAISTIEESAFGGLYNLLLIDLSLNKLTVIGEKILLPTISLMHLNISHNYVNSLDTITSSSLKSLDASYCEIYSISRYSLSNLPKLATLSLARNFISSLPDFWTGDRLIELDIHGCRLKTINNKTFKQMYYLRKLDLSSNRLSYVDPSFFPQNLAHIQLDDNQWICDCTKLKPMYDELYMNGGDTDILICDSPENVSGTTWRDACEEQWFPNRNQKKQLWWYSVAVVISMTCFLIIIVALRKITAIKEKRIREADELRRNQEREAREALQRMHRMHREYREQESRNAPDPRELQSPPSYTDALLLPRLDSSVGSLASIASRGSQGSTGDASKKGRIRRKRRRKRSETESRRQSRVTVDSSDSSDQEQQRIQRPPLESDF